MKFKSVKLANFKKIIYNSKRLIQSGLDVEGCWNTGSRC